MRSTASSRTPQANLPDNPIRAELSGDTFSALGHEVVGAAPVIGLCAVLVASGHDPGRGLHAFRGGTLALRVRSIGEAARLRVAPHGVGFERLPGCTAAPRARLSRQEPLAPTSAAPRSVASGAYLPRRGSYWRERLAGMVRRRAGAAR